MVLDQRSPNWKTLHRRKLFPLQTASVVLPGMITETPTASPSGLHDEPLLQLATPARLVHGVLHRDGLP